MTPLLVLRVSGRPPDLHSGKHINRWARARETAMRRSYIKVMAQGVRHGAKMEKATERRRLHVTIWWRGVKRDDANLMQDLKADVDGLVDAGWLVNDNRKWLAWDYPPEYRQADDEHAVAIEYSLFAAEAKDA